MRRAATLPVPGDPHPTTGQSKIAGTRAEGLTIFIRAILSDYIRVKSWWKGAVTWISKIG